MSNYRHSMYDLDFNNTVFIYYSYIRLKGVIASLVLRNLV